MPPSLQHDTTKDRIYQKLRRSIILGEYHPGQKLPLEELADHYQTSVTPVREALQMLAQEDLVTSKPHSGFSVTMVSLKELKDLLELREILELAAVERAAAKISVKQIEELKNVHGDTPGSDQERYERSVIENRKFHTLIARASGNQELAEMLGKVHDKLARFFVFVHSASGVQERHQRLISALRTHQVDLARETMRKEIEETEKITLQRVIEEDGTSWYLGAHGEQPEENLRNST